MIWDYCHRRRPEGVFYDELQTMTPTTHLTLCLRCPSLSSEISHIQLGLEADEETGGSQWGAAYSDVYDRVAFSGGFRFNAHISNLHQCFFPAEELLCCFTLSVRCLSCGLESSAKSTSLAPAPWMILGIRVRVPARLQGPFHYLSLNVFKFA